MFIDTILSFYILIQIQSNKIICIGERNYIYKHPFNDCLNIFIIHESFCQCHVILRTKLLIFSYFYSITLVVLVSLSFTKMYVIHLTI